ncbi:hypothetical protein [Nonomuraea sp. NPDC050783]|uniref:hypothetical protein n=1 Tax=Nonomuraea sp. NPDC050783 TaxID=3154634 RepID=UPI0034654DA3
MSNNLMDSLAPVLSTPVTRALTSTAADDSGEVGQSIFGVTTGGFTFAGDEQE